MVEAKAPITVDNMMQVAFCLEGRDKLTKVLQYGSRALAYYILSVDPKSDVGLRLRRLFLVAQQARKVFRLGKSATFAKKVEALVDNEAKGNSSMAPWQHRLSLIQNIGMLMYFLHDNAALLGSAQILPLNTPEISKRGGTVWFTANSAGIILAVHALQEVLAKERRVQEAMADAKEEARVEELKGQLVALRDTRMKKVVSFVKITCDWIVSSNTPGVRLAERLWGKKLNDGVIGICGCIAAMLVLYNTWPTQPRKISQQQSVAALKQEEKDQAKETEQQQHLQQNGTAAANEQAGH